MENTDFSKMPVNWTVCTQAECPRHEGCLRYRAYEFINGRHTRQSCVLPSARSDMGCRFHIPYAKVPVAWGMRTTLSGVREDDARRMRPLIKALFRSRSTYYRYYNGRFPISPRQQQAIRRIFQCFGYNPEHVRFDRIEEDYFFPRS